MVNKKGYMRTLEAVIAVIILLIVVFTSSIFKTPKEKAIPPEIELIQDTIFDNLQNDHREYLIDENSGEVEDLISEIIGGRGINSEFDICMDVGDCEIQQNLSEDDIYVNSLIIHENESTVLFRLYLWYS